MEADFPKNINYWISSTSNHDCFFKVGQEPGPVEKIGAVKILLTGHSEVFRKMLDESALAETGDILVTDSDPDTFKSFLKCVYGGTEIVSLKLSFEKCLKVLYLCEKYLVVDVKEKLSMCMLELHQPLSVQNTFLALSYPASLTDENLENVVVKIIQNDTEKILSDKLFVNLDSTALKFIALQSNLSCKEIKLWQAFLDWAKHKMSTDSTIKDLRSCLVNVLKYIRFCTMESKEFCTHVVPSGVLTPEEIVEICNSLGTEITPVLGDACEDIVNRYKEPSSHADFMLTHIIQKIDEFSVTSSKVITFSNFKWCFSFTQIIGSQNLGLNLSCQPASPTNDWKCNASVELILVNQFRKPNFSLSYSHMFCDDEVSWGFRSLMSWDKLLNLKNGFVRNGNIVVVAKVEFYI